MTDRNPDGTFAEGNNANPQGVSGAKDIRGYIPYATRAMMLQERYTVDEIKAIVTDAALFGNLSVQDGQIMRHLANTLVGDEIGIERERLIDRLDGKAQQPVKFSGDKDNPLQTTVTLKF